MLNTDNLTTPDVDLTNKDDYLLKNNNIVIARTGASTGKTYLYNKADGTTYFAGFLIRAEIKEMNDGKFIFNYTLTTKYNNFIKINSMRSGQPGINSKELGMLKIKIPNLKEQKQIGVFFEKIDNLIRLKSNKIDSLERLKRGYLQKTLADLNKNIPELRFKCFDDNWEKIELDKITDVKDGTHESPKYVESGYPLITSKNLLDNGLDMNNVSYISTKDFESINKRSKVDKGDIIFGMIGTIGKPNIIYNNDFAIKNVALIKNNSHVNNYFILNLLKSNVFDKYIYSHNAGGTQKFISLNLIRNFSFNAPSLEEQKKIGALFNSIDKQIKLQKKELERLKALKKGYLQKMFI